MRQRLIALHESQWGPWWISGLAGLLLIAVAAFSGLIQNYFSGEEFLVYHYASNFAHTEAWQQFFFQNGRLIEALYWTYEYEVLGYQPLLFHAISFVLLLILALLATACFLNVWPRKGRSQALPYLFIFLLFLNWIVLSNVLRLSYDNGRLSMIFFFAAGLALQRWAASQRGRWLLLSYALFLVCVMTYENAVFLFPALVLLAWPLLPAEKRANWRQRVLIFGSLSALSGLILLMPYWLYGFILQSGLGSVATPARNFAIGEFFAQLSRYGPAVYVGFGQVVNFGQGPWNMLVAIGLLAVILIASLWIVRLHRSPQPEMDPDTKLRWTSIFMAALWFLFFGPLPYILAGFGAGARVYSSAIFGVFLLLMLNYERTEPVVRRLALVLIVLFATVGLFVLSQESTRVIEGEAAEVFFYSGLKDVVPHVRADTVFFIIDGPIGNSGCGPSLEMLYLQRDLNCAILSSVYDKYMAVRRDLVIETSGQELTDENVILILVEGDRVRLLDQIAPGDDFGIYIDWESAEPIRTNTDKIVSQDLPAPSSFYLHLLERAAVLLPRR